MTDLDRLRQEAEDARALWHLTRGTPNASPRIRRRLELAVARLAAADPSRPQEAAE